MQTPDQLFEQAAESATLECKRLGYYPRYTLDLINRLGSYLAAARDMLDRSTDPTGLTRLWDLGRLDLSIEYLALCPQFAELFTEAQREVARQRLTELNFPLPSDSAHSRA